MKFNPNIAFITLGVADLARARMFYKALGWEEGAQSNEGVAFFELNGIILSLFPRTELAKDANQHDSKPGFTGITIAYNTDSIEETDAAFQHAIACGATPVKPPHAVFWGGYSGYFADPDGHLWEVAHNPFGRFDERGQFRMT